MGSCFLRRRTFVRAAFTALLVTLFAGTSRAATTWTVDDDGVQCVPDFATIQAAIAAALPGDTINVCPGTYVGPIVVDKQLFLLGAQAGTDARGRFVGAPDPNVEAVITGAPGTLLLQLVLGSAGTVIDGFAFSGGNRAIESAGLIHGLQVRNTHVSGFTGNGIFLNDPGTDITFAQDVIDGASKTGGGGLFHLDQDLFDGFRLLDSWILNGVTATGLFVDGNHNVRPSLARIPQIQGNLVQNNLTGMNLGRFAFTGGLIADNVFDANLFDGLQGGIQSTSIDHNTFVMNGRSGLALTGFGGAGDPTRGAQNSTVTCNLFERNGLVQNGEGLFFSASQFPGTISTNQANDNNFIANLRGATYLGTETIDVENNWWSSPSGPTNPANPGGTGQVVNATTLDFTPWLTSAATCSPPPTDSTPPSTSCSIGRRVITPATRGLFDVGASFSVSDDTDPVPALFRTVTVWSDEAAGLPPYAPDATLTQPPPVLKLRAERAIPGNGRIYLVELRATDTSGNVGVDCCTAVVPLNTTVSHLTALLSEAAFAEASCDAGTGAPPGYDQPILAPTVLLP
jgi:hypothetical protein